MASLVNVGLGEAGPADAQASLQGSRGLGLTAAGQEEKRGLQGSHAGGQPLCILGMLETRPEGTRLPRGCPVPKCVVTH